MWFSSGGTKSVLHNDDVDNINCLYRGNKTLTFVSRFETGKVGGLWYRLQVLIISSLFYYDKI